MLEEPMRSVILLSAGLDSSVNLLAALQEGEVLKALTFDYGQRAADKEIQKAKALCAKYKVDHEVVDLRFFSKITKTSLVNRDMDIPTGKNVNIESQEGSAETAEKVWVPNRNGTFLNIAASFAEGLGASHIIPGFNLEEAQTFPDNSQEFVHRLNASFELSTMKKIKVHCFTINMQKKEIAELGDELGLDFHSLWPCYFGEEKWCGECESCQRFQRAAGDYL